MIDPKFTRGPYLLFLSDDGGRTALMETAPVLAADWYDVQVKTGECSEKGSGAFSYIVVPQQWAVAAPSMLAVAAEILAAVTGGQKLDAMLAEDPLVEKLQAAFNFAQVKATLGKDDAMWWRLLVVEGDVEPDLRPTKYPNYDAVLAAAAQQRADHGDDDGLFPVAFDARGVLIKIDSFGGGEMQDAVAKYTHERDRMP